MRRSSSRSTTRLAIAGNSDQHKLSMTRREFVNGLAGLAAFTSASLEAALAGGRKTLVIGASRAGCEYALAHPAEAILLERGILPAIELGHDQTDAWAEKLVDAKCRVLLCADLESIEKLPDGTCRVVAHGPDGRHVFSVSAVKDMSVTGWHKGEWR